MKYTSPLLQKQNAFIKLKKGTLVVLITLALVMNIFAAQTVVTNVPTDDTFGREGSTTENNNYNGQGIWFIGSSPANRINFLKWTNFQNFTGTVTNAELRLYQYVWKNTDSGASTVPAMTYCIYILTNTNWQEGTLTYNNMPSYDATDPYLTFTATTNYTVSHEIPEPVGIVRTNNVTSLITNLLSGGSPERYPDGILSLVLAMDVNDASTYATTAFYDSENADPAMQPAIILYLSPPILTFNKASGFMTNEPFDLGVTVTEDSGYISTTGLGGTYTAFPKATGTNIALSLHTNIIYYYGNNGTLTSETNAMTYVIYPLKETTPADGVTWIPPSTTLSLEFNFPISNSLVNFANIVVSNHSDNSVVSGTWSPAAGTHTNVFTFTPSSAFADENEVGIYIAKNLRLTNGDTMDYATNITFTCGFNVNNYETSDFTFTPASVPLGCDYEVTVSSPKGFINYLLGFDFALGSSTTNIATYVTNSDSNVTFTLPKEFTSNAGTGTITPTVLLGGGTATNEVTTGAIAVSNLAFTVTPSTFSTGIETRVTLTSPYVVTNHIAMICVTQGTVALTNALADITFDGTSQSFSLTASESALFSETASVAVVVYFTNNATLGSLVAGTLSPRELRGAGTTVGLNKTVLTAGDTTLRVVYMGDATTGQVTADIITLDGMMIGVLTQENVSSDDVLTFDIQPLKAGVYMLRYRITTGGATKTHYVTFLVTR